MAAATGWAQPMAWRLTVSPTWLGERSGEARGSIDHAFDFRGLLERRIINVHMNTILLSLILTCFMQNGLLADPDCISITGDVLGIRERERAHFFGSGSTREAKMSFEKQSETYSLVLVTFGSCLWVRMFASVSPTMNSDPSIGQVFSIGAGGPKWGVDSLPLFDCVLR
ncbi:hypothetical protein CRG98_004786 [Punica granatum]|uniref:Uncharacterized protein n=1 Tax=Punica granatum TaxID=22663 RepID=A0A2I0L266_PUNGR|nr:hypothetical protein CRG98_004786 [Punica granatum]